MSDIPRHTDYRQALAAVIPTVEEIESELGVLIPDDEGKPYE